MTGEIIEEIIDHNWKFFILVFQNSNGNCDLHNMSNLQNNTDSLGAKIDKAKIPNGWKITFLLDLEAGNILGKYIKCDIAI